MEIENLKRALNLLKCYDEIEQRKQLIKFSSCFLIGGETITDAETVNEVKAILFKKIEEEKKELLPYIDEL